MRSATGAHLLWRVLANRVLDVEQALPDGSWRSRLYAAGDRLPGAARWLQEDSEATTMTMEHRG